MSDSLFIAFLCFWFVFLLDRRERSDRLVARYRESHTGLEKCLAKMVQLMDEGEEPGAGSAWHVRATAALKQAREVEK
jgi:hypothetical protein